MISKKISPLAGVLQSELRSQPTICCPVAEFLSMNFFKPLSGPDDQAGAPGGSPQIPHNDVGHPLTGPGVLKDRAPLAVQLKGQKSLRKPHKLQTIDMGG